MKELTAMMVSRLRFGFTWLTGMPRVGRIERRHWSNMGYLVGWTLIVVVPLLYMGLFQLIKSDHDLHVHHIQAGIESGAWLVHFLFGGMVYLVSGFSHDYDALARSALIVLTVCVAAKACLTYAVLVRKCPALPGGIANSSARWSHETLLLVVAAALMLSAPIVRPWQANRVYIGQLSPNVWHNPTCLVCWPIIILLFFVSYEYLQTKRAGLLWVIGALGAIGVLAKPNYFLAWAPVFCLFSFGRFGLSRLWLLSQAALLPTVAILFWQLTASFGGPDAMRAERQIAWLPFAAWQLHSQSIPLSIMFSLAFPASYLIVFRRTLQHRGMLMFAWGVMLSALFWALCFAEVHMADGTPDFDFNFSWGAHLAAYILFLATAIDICGNPAAIAAIGRPSLGKWKLQLPWTLLGLHAASGIIWIARQFAGKGFM